MGNVSEEQIMNLANSLRDNRLVANIEEAIEKAREILSLESPQERMSADKFSLVAGTEGQSLSSIVQIHTIEKTEEEEIDFDFGYENVPDGIIDPTWIILREGKNN
jgi:hypothetical protein